MIILNLPYPNSANTHWKIARNRIYISASGLRYRIKVAEYISDNPIKAPEGFLELIIALHPDSKRRADIDNRIKPLLDALTHSGFMEDDSLVSKITIERMPIVKGGKATVIVLPYNNTTNGVDT
jgi:crossover junction endodeoxyribonuclease RusA